MFKEKAITILVCAHMAWYKPLLFQSLSLPLSLPRPLSSLTKRVGDERTAVTDMHIVSFDDVVDVGGDRGVGADAMLLHLLDQLALRQIPRWRRLPIAKGERGKTEAFSLSKVRQPVLVLYN